MMNNAESESTDVKQLKQEVAALQKQVQALTQTVKDITRFFQIQPADPEQGIEEYVVLRCSHFVMFHRGSKGDKCQLRMMVTDEGPALTLYNTDEQPRITLHAQNGQAQLELFSAASVQAVLIEADQSNGRGLVGVFDSGKPRALIKGGDGEGVVSVVHDDGRPRICLRSSPERGELNVVSAEGRAAVSILGTPGGGSLHINDTSGARQAILAASPGGGQLLLFNDLGIQRAHLGSAQDSAALTLNWGGNSGIVLAAVHTGGTLVFNDADGKPVAQLPSSGDAE